MQIDRAIPTSLSRNALPRGAKNEKEAALELARNAKHHAFRTHSSWALTKVRTHEERHAVAPIDASLLSSLEASAYESFLSSLRQQTWTGYAESVTLTYQSSTRDGENVPEPTPDVLDEVARRVDAFFGTTSMAQQS